MSRQILPKGYYVGYRLKKTRRYFKGRASIREARSYYRSLKGKKTRYFHKDYDLGELVTHTLKTRTKSLRDAVLGNNPIYEMLKSRNYGY